MSVLLPNSNRGIIACRTVPMASASPVARTCHWFALRLHHFLGLAHENRRLRLEHELGVTELSHLRYVQAGQFRFRRDSMTDKELDRQVDDHADGENDANQRGDTH